MTGSARRVLLVEDDPGHAALIKRAFAPWRARFELDVVATLSEARVRLDRQSYDLVIADLLLPDGRASQLLPEHEGDPPFPLVILTSFGNEQLAVDLLKRGALDYVVKSSTSLADMPHLAERALREWQLRLDRERAERALRDSEALFRSLVEHLPFNFFRKDVSGRFVYCNESMAASLGLRPSEVLGKTDFDLFPPELARQYRDDDQRVMREEVTIEREEEHETAKTGRIWVRVVKAPVRDATGRVVGVQGLYWDISDQVRAREELQKREEQLAHVSRLTTMGELVAGLAHEVAQPLSAVSNYAAACAAALSELPELPAQALEWLSRIDAEVRRAGAILSNMRNFARRASPNRALHDFRKIVRDAVELLSFELRRHGVEVVLDLPDCERPVIADAVQLQQVVVNLLQNAYEAVEGLEPSRCRVHISVCDCPDVVRVAVSDAGRGLPPDVPVARLFEPFFTTKSDGTGMGLAICRRVVEAHGGEITAQANEGYGATFSFTLPLVRQHDPRRIFRF